jgi:transposase
LLESGEVSAVLGQRVHPRNHLLRLIDKHIDFGFVRELLKDGSSETGRPSVDPELLLRILLIGYLCQRALIPAH